MEEETFNSKDFVTCLKWIKAGIPNPNPVQIKYTKEELKQIIDKTRRNLLNENQDLENLDLGDDVEMIDEEQIDENNPDADIIDKYGLDDYEDSSDDEQRNIIGGFGNLVHHESNENDPYLNPEDNEDEESENEDFNLKPNDNLLLVGHVQEDASSLEVYVYNEEDNFVHHDVYLPAFPMCIETINYDSKNEKNCNWAAIGDMTKEIKIWDIDIVNELEPLYTLKGHKDTVIDLSWNHKVKNILASCSVDRTVHLWDLKINKSIHKIKKFNDRIQSIDFNKHEEGKLIAGDCEGKISLIDCNNLSIQTFSIDNCEIEKVIWKPDSSNIFFASTDKGSIHLFDTRVRNEIQSISAHSDSVTDLTFSTNGLFLSVGADSEVKIWNVSSNKFDLIDTYKNSNVGKIFAISANPDLPTIFAVGGDNKEKSIEIIDISKIESVKTFLNL